MKTGRRILVVNPNTSGEVTEAYLAAARRIAPDDVTFDGVTGRFGASIVSTEAENIIAGHSALELVADHWRGHDAVILAISFDTALAGIRSLLPVPVTGITEAALHAAKADGRRIGVVFFGEVSRALYAGVLARYGAEPVGFEAIDIASSADYLAPAAKDRAVAEACARLAECGAEAVVICGAAIVGMAARLQGNAALPLYDGSEAVTITLAAIERGEPSPPRLAPVGGTTGLPPALAALLRGEALSR